MIWRHFAPDAILMVKSTNPAPGGASPRFSPPAHRWRRSTADILTTTAPVQIEETLRLRGQFRSNGFLTAAVIDQDGVAAWQERVNIDRPAWPGGRTKPARRARGCPLDRRRPAWTDVDGVANNRRAVDLADRETREP
jgi:hypothetical protein